MAAVIGPRLEWRLPEPLVDPPSFTGFTAPVATLLARRGIRTDDELGRFLTAGAETMHPISQMADAELALDRIDQAIATGESIAIWGDYDADGISAIAVWVLGLRALGVEAERYVPSRWSEGYGLSRVGLEALAGLGVRLVITCDCGIANVAEVEVARSLGVDVIVTDHHLPGPMLPRAVAVVDPHRPDCGYPDHDLTGAGLAYKLASALLDRRGRSAPDLAGVAAIGTVADLAPMTGESRAIVRLGLEEFATSDRPGLRALLARSAVDPANPTIRDLGYSIAPRINAAGRIAEAELALKLLVSEDPEEASRLMDELDAVHERRRDLTAVALEEARGLADGQAGTDGPLLLRQDAWAPGIIGLIAGRLADELARPVAVVCAVEDELRGSVRAPGDFHVAAALEACAGLLTKRGGHAGAGGFSLLEGNWAAFVAAFGTLPRPYPPGRATTAERAGQLAVDLVLPASRLDWSFAAQLDQLRPYGPGNAEPVLAVTGMLVADARRVGASEAHIGFRMRRGLETFDAVAFGTPAERPLPAAGDALDLVGTLERDTFQGIDRLRLRVIDYAHSQASPLLARRLPRSTAVPELAAAG
jgi:single-stranded-DNA-specific exonuclease